MSKPDAEPAKTADAAPEPLRYKLRLFVSGATPRSTQAIQNIKEIGERLLHGHYELEVIDAYQQADLVRDEQIIALPTLVKQLPLPLRRIVGDLSDDDRVVLGLELTLDEPDNDLEKPDDD